MGADHVADSGACASSLMNPIVGPFSTAFCATSQSQVNAFVAQLLDNRRLAAPDAYAYADSNANSDTDSDSYTNAGTDSDADPDAHTDTNTAGKGQRRTSIEWRSCHGVLVPRWR